MLRLHPKNGLRIKAFNRDAKPLGPPPKPAAAAEADDAAAAKAAEAPAEAEAEAGAEPGAEAEPDAKAEAAAAGGAEARLPSAETLPYLDAALVTPELFLESREAGGGRQACNDDEAPAHKA